MFTFSRKTKHSPTGFNFSLSKTEHKIALFISLLVGSLLIVSTFASFKLIDKALQKSEQDTLESAIKTVIKDYQSSSYLKEKSTVFQLRNSSFLSNVNTSSEPADTSDNSAGQMNTKALLTNVNQTKVFSPEKTLLDKKISKDELVAQYKELDQVFATLKQNPQVYSRVLSADGAIIFTSDLFNSLNLDPKSQGFHTIERDSICVNVLTSQVSSPPHQGTTVQVGQYCRFPQATKNLVLFYIGTVNLLLTVFSYAVGWLGAKWLIKPLNKAAAKTKQFSQNCYHELLTPLSVALSTAQASLKQKTFETGLNSVMADLISMKDVVDTLGLHAQVSEGKMSDNTCSLNQIIEAEVEKLLQLFKQDKIKIATTLEPNISVAFDPVATKIIVHNLLLNALQNSPGGSTIHVELSRLSLSISNQVSSSMNLDLDKIWERGYSSKSDSTSHGIGLPIVKELCQAADWKIKFGLDKSSSVHTARVEITFN